MAARRRPYTTGEDGIPLDSTRTGGASTPLSSSPSIWGDMRSSLPGRTGVCWAGAWAEVGGCDPQGTRGSIRWCIPQEARPSGILPPGSSWNTRSETTPLRPGVQDAGRGRPGAPSSKTSSLRHRFQGCPRHARQPKSGQDARPRAVERCAITSTPPRQRPRPHYQRGIGNGGS